MDSLLSTKTSSNPSKSRTTLPSGFENLFQNLKARAISHRHDSFENRADRLKKIEQLILKAREPLKVALAADFGKPYLETDLSEILPTLLELGHAKDNLKSWMSCQKVPTPVRLVGTHSEIRPEPKGVVLIFGPWNYPFSLVINPLIAALAAGNTVVIKPSELCPANSNLLKRLVEEFFDPSEVCVVEGDSTVSQKLLELPFDHIFFTGSERVGKLVYQAAARRLTPVTLELGGKSPVVIDESFSIKTAAERICWGKFINSGQTCIAPDFVCLPQARVPEFINHCLEQIKLLFGETESARSLCPDLSKIINENNLERLKGYLKKLHPATEEILCGGLNHCTENYFPPTLVKTSKWDSSLMIEEIFGPILTIIPYDSKETLVGKLQSLPKPLALYVFSKSQEFQDFFINNVPSGGVCINHVVIHIMNPNLPFGGIGSSGMGAYHGEAGFWTFSHARSVMSQSPWVPSLVDSLKPPYDKKSAKIITDFNIKLGSGIKL